MDGDSAHVTEEKAVGQNGEVICLRSQSKMAEELVPALWAEWRICMRVLTQRAEWRRRR